MTSVDAIAVRPTRRYVEQVMGMPISLALRGRHAGDALGRDAWHHALATLRDADRVFSPYRPDSVVSRVDRGELRDWDGPPASGHVSPFMTALATPHTLAGGVADTAQTPGVRACRRRASERLDHREHPPALGTPALAEVLALGELARVQSGGAFDVRRGSEGSAGSQIRFDPSGVVKGWAVDRAFAPLRALADTDACLSAGGDLVCHVSGPRSPDWRIGIEDPHDPTRLVAVVPVRDGAVATSGLAHRGGHVTDARTGAVPREVASVTVVANDLTWADIDATAALAQDGDALSWLRGRPRRSGLVVWADGRTETFGT